MSRSLPAREPRRDAATAAVALRVVVIALCFTVGCGSTTAKHATTSRTRTSPTTVAITTLPASRLPPGVATTTDGGRIVVTVRDVRAQPYPNNPDDVIVTATVDVTNHSDQPVPVGSATQLDFGCPADETYFNTGYPDNAMMAQLGITPGDATVPPGGEASAQALPTTLPRSPSHCAHGTNGSLLLALADPAYQGHVDRTVSIPDLSYDALPIDTDVAALLAGVPPA